MSTHNTGFGVRAVPHQAQPVGTEATVCTSCSGGKLSRVALGKAWVTGVTRTYALACMQQDVVGRLGQVPNDQVFLSTPARRVTGVLDIRVGTILIRDPFGPWTSGLPPGSSHLPPRILKLPSCRHAGSWATHNPVRRK